MHAEFYFSTGTVTSAFFTGESDFTHTEIYYNNLKSADNSVQIKIPYDTALLNAINAHADDNVKVSIINNDGSKYFTGYIRKTFSFSKTQHNQPVSLELVSPSYLLDKDTAEAIYLTDSPSLSVIVTALLDAAGMVPPALSLSETLPVFVLDEGSNIYDTLSELLQQYGYCFDFDAEGIFYITTLFDKPPQNITQIFNGTNCLKEIQVQKKEQEYDAAKITWNKVELKKNTLIFSDTTDQTDVYKCKIKIDAGAYIFGEEENYCTYDSTLGEIKYVESITPALKFADSSYLDVTCKNKGLKALLSIHNRSSNIRYCLQLDIYGNAYICTSENITKSGSGSKYEEITADWIFNKDTAAVFAENMANWHRYADYTVTVTSRTVYAPGTFVKVTDNGLGTITGRIIKRVRKSLRQSAAIDYTIEAVSEYEAATVSTTSGHGSSGSAQPLRDTTPPTVPVISSIAVNDIGNIVLVWTESSDDSGIARYTIYRKKESGTWYTIASTKELSYTDESTAKNAAYTYRITATDSSGNESDYSSEKQIKSAVAVKPPVPDNITAVADNQNYIRISFTPAATVTEEQRVKYYSIYISRDKGTSYTLVDSVTANLYDYYFNRSLDGYPEKENLANYRFMIRPISVYGVNGDRSDAVTVNTDTYGTWAVSPAVITVRKNGRTITLSPAQSDSSLARYGNIRYRIFIRKPSSDPEDTWYKPDLAADPYAAVANYKNGDGFITVTGVFSQTLPLDGQNEKEPLPVDTAYQFKIVSFNEAHEGTAVTVTAAALATGARDITAAAITENKLAKGCVTADKIHAGTITGDKIATTDLAANGAVLGNISGNKVGTDSNNCWKGLDTNTPEFRIGNDKALEDNGDDKAVFFHFQWIDGIANIAMKINNFILTAVASIIKGVFRIKAKTAADAASFLTVNPETSADSTTGTPAQTVQVNGAVKATGIITASSFSGSLSGNAATATQAQTCVYPFPVGSVYLQLKGQAAPSSLFGGTWADVTGSYANRYLAAAGDRLAFGTDYSDGLPNIAGFFYRARENQELSVSGCFYSYGSFSGAVDTTGNSTHSGVGFSAANSNGIYGAAGFVRPATTVIKIWQRTA